MNKTRLHIYVFITVTATVLLISFFSFRYLYQVASDKLWTSKMESGKRESREIGRLLEQQLLTGIEKPQVIRNLQQSIENTDVQSEFICMYDKNGIELCHPNPALIGQKIEQNNSRLDLGEGKNSISFSEVISSQQKLGGVRNFPEDQHRSSEIVNVYPVKGSDWIVASHANIDLMHQELSDLYKQFSIGFLLSTLIIITCCLLLIRRIYSRHEQALEEEITGLNEKINSLSTLNLQLNTLQEKLQDQILVQQPEREKENGRKRIITYHKDELIHLDVSEIAYFFLDGSTVLIFTFDNKQFSTNNSLDELMKQLDNDIFYRANRQFIINMRSIKTIFIYGKNQLRIVTDPKTSEPVIISKNKVAEFKKWLDR
nr:LytTR family transcriptional regulator DNA-binding domain-containing protein [uncultured Pedobacter sp.]